MQKRNLLPGGCCCSAIAVQPKDWKRSAKAIQKPWRIYYRFWDPTILDPKTGKPKAHFVEIKGMNLYTDLKDRRIFTEDLIEQEWIKLKEQGYNPATGQYTITPPELEYEIDPNTPFIKALRLSLERLVVEEDTRGDIGSTINGVERAATQLRYDELPVQRISLKHINIILLHCSRINPRWSAATHNRYRAYLLMLFKKLLQFEAVLANPVRDVERMKRFKKLSSVLSKEERILIDAHLRERHPRFHQFVNLFFHSGGRLRELVTLKGQDVDLARQVYKTVIKKGTMHREVERPIKDIAIPFWAFFLEGCAVDQYLFGPAYKNKRQAYSPWKKPMAADTITRHWQELVKNPVEMGGLGINKGLYPLKHLNATETAVIAGDEAAAGQMGHLSTTMLRTVYDVTRQEREQERMRGVANAFVPSAKPGSTMG
jgi:integrase